MLTGIRIGRAPRFSGERDCLGSNLGSISPHRSYVTRMDSSSNFKERYAYEVAKVVTVKHQRMNDELEKTESSYPPFTKSNHTTASSIPRPERCSG
jgi:hypothetical protein